MYPNNNPGSLTLGSTAGWDPGAVIPNATADNFKVELWVNPTSTHQVDTEIQSGTDGLVGQKYAIAPYWTGFTSPDAGMGISVGTNGITVYEHADAYMPPILVWAGAVTGWTHIAVVYENKQPRLYVNGVLVHTGLVSLRTHVRPGNLVGYSFHGVMTGEIDEVRVWDGIKTQQQRSRRIITTAIARKKIKSIINDNTLFTD